MLTLLYRYDLVHKILVNIYISEQGRLNTLLPGKFFMNFCRLLIFFKINFFEKLF